MLLIIIILSAFTVSLFINKGFKGIEKKELNGIRFLIIGFAIQLLIFNKHFAKSKISNFTPLLYIISLLILYIFLLLNLNYKGIGITLIGFSMNIITIIANKGYMPQDINKLYIIGEKTKAKLILQYGHFYNATVMSKNTHLNIFSDRIIIPFLKSLSAVYSIGDVIIIIGICIFIFEYMRNDRAGQQNTRSILN